MRNREQLIRDIASAINRNSAENDSNTPDFILAEMLVDHLETFGKASKHREKWYGKELRIGANSLGDVVSTDKPRGTTGER